MTKVLFIIRGLPGSGKSTLANAICECVFSSDMFFEKDGTYNFDVSKVKDSHHWCESQAENAMKGGIEKIAVANTFTEEWEMLPYYEIADKYKYQVHSIIVENRHRNKNIHGVPDEKLEMMSDRFEIML
jgi:predicted kinase